jgi:hypothetical protein
VLKKKKAKLVLVKKPALKIKPVAKKVALLLQMQHQLATLQHQLPLARKKKVEKHVAKRKVKLLQLVQIREHVNSLLVAS